MNNPITIVSKDGMVVGLGYLHETGRKFYTVVLGPEIAGGGQLIQGPVLLLMSEVDILEGHRYDLAAEYLERRAALFRWVARREAQATEIEAGIHDRIARQTATALRKWEKENPAPAPSDSPVAPEDAETPPADGAEGPVAAPADPEPVPTSGVAEDPPDEGSNEPEPHENVDPDGDGGAGVVRDPDPDYQGPEELAGAEGFRVGDTVGLGFPDDATSDDDADRIRGVITEMKQTTAGVTALVDVGGCPEVHGLRDLHRLPQGAPDDLPF